MRLIDKDDGGALTVERGEISYASNVTGKMYAVAGDLDAHVGNNTITFFDGDCVAFRARLEAESQLDELEKLGFDLFGRVY